VTVLQSAPSFNEFTVSLPKAADQVVGALLAKGIVAGLPLGQYFEGSQNLMVVTVTEKRSKKEIDLLVKELEVALCT